MTTPTTLRNTQLRFETTDLFVDKSMHRVGIGTATPSEKLDVGGWLNIVDLGGVQSGIRFDSSGSGTFGTIYRDKDTANLVIQAQTGGYTLLLQPSGGAVGIGVAIPSALLHTSLASSGHVPMLYSAGLMPQFPRKITNASAEISTNDTTAGTGAVIGLNLENSSQVDGTYSPLLTFSRHSASGDYNTVFASIGGFCVGDGHDTDWTAGDLVFGTTPIGTTGYGPYQRMRIKDDGKIIIGGIGIFPPYSLLEVLGDSFSEPSLVALDGGLFSVGSAYNFRTVFSQSINSPYTFSIQHKHATVDGVPYPIALNPLGGNIGIGTINPLSRLHIFSGSSGLTLGTQGVTLESNTHSYIQVAAPANTQQGILFAGGASTFLNDGGILWEDGSRGDYLSILAGNAERIVVLANGFVGIGINPPTQTLQVAGSVILGNMGVVGATHQIRGVYDATSGVIAQFISGVNGGRSMIGFSDGYTYNFGLGTEATSGDLVFNSALYPTVTGTERMRIMQGGNVGIGTNNPTDILDVLGASRFGDHATNYAHFAADGELTLLGTARIKKHVTFELAGLGNGESAPSLTRLGDSVGYGFGMNDDGYATFELPLDWDSTTDITISFHFYVNEAYATNSGEIRFQAGWSAVSDVGTEPVDGATHTGTLTGADMDIPATAKALQEYDIGVLPHADLELDDTIFLLISRIALVDGNNPTARPVLTLVECEYTANRLGTAL